MKQKFKALTGSIISIIGLLLLTSLSFGQISADKLNAIDSLFIEWNSPNHPGGSVGVAVKGVPLFSKAYGLASMEYLIPNNYGTSFNIASVSKQFTAMGIVKLHLQGKLNIDDDIREYLPELPDFGHKISFRHMLHHTSGLRSLHTMLSLAGWRKDDMRNNDDLLRFVTMQQDLNFEPGSEYMYCNTGYILSAIIIERITGESFADWMRVNVFNPLGLYETYVEDKYNNIAHNYATSYNGSSESGFVKEIEFWAYTGSGNIHSTSNELLKWMRYYYKPPEGWEEAFSMMLTLDPFNDGKPNKYAFGVNVDRYENEKRIHHSGSIGGFRAYVSTFPEHEIDIVVLTNFSSSDPAGKVKKIADILLDKKKPEKPLMSYQPKETDVRIFDKHAGVYKTEDTPDRLFELFRRGDTLLYKYSGGSETRLYTASDSVLFNNKEGVKITLVNAVPERVLIMSDGKEIGWKKTQKHIPDIKELEGIAGNYWSPELETQYRFYLEDGKLFGFHPRHGSFDVECVTEDIFISDSAFINKIRVIRKGKNVIGMRVTNSRVRDLWLEKK